MKPKLEWACRVLFMGSMGFSAYAGTNDLGAQLKAFEEQARAVVQAVDQGDPEPAIEIVLGAVELDRVATLQEDIFRARMQVLAQGQDAPPDDETMGQICLGIGIQAPVQRSLFIAAAEGWLDWQGTDLVAVCRSAYEGMTNSTAAWVALLGMWTNRLATTIFPPILDVAIDAPSGLRSNQVARATVAVSNWGDTPATNVSLTVEVRGAAQRDVQHAPLPDVPPDGTVRYDFYVTTGASKPDVVGLLASVEADGTERARADEFMYVNVEPIP